MRERVAALREVWDARQTGAHLFRASVAVLESLEAEGMLHSWRSAAGGRYWMLTARGGAVLDVDCGGRKRGGR